MSVRADTVAHHRRTDEPLPLSTMAPPPVPDTSTRALVLSAQNYGCLGIIRSLGRLGIPVHAVDADPPRAAAYSRYLKARHVFDLAAATPEATVDYLLDLGRRLGGRTVLIPTWDQTSLLVSDHADVLGEWYIFPRQPAGLAAALADKRSMHFLAREHGVPTPGAVFPESVEDVNRYAASAVFPVMLKGIDGKRLKLRTGHTMVIVNDPDELVRRYVAMEDPAQPNLMLQEFIPGGEHDVWMFNGYFDQASDALMGFTGRKLRQSPVYTGVTSLGVCEPNTSVRDTTTRWMKAIGYRGILDIGYRFDARDGQYKVLDANPRIGSTFRLFVARDGLDVARALYLDLTGQRVPPATESAGRRWMVEGADVDSALQYRRDGKLTMRDWATSLLGVRETAYFARDDLAPFRVAMRGFARRKSSGGRG
jgi:D-aspartate ligase